MKSLTTRRFRQALDALPSDVRRLAGKNFRLWCSDPGHPSLRYRRLNGGDDSQSALGITTGHWVAVRLNPPMRSRT
jgi:hypothetical protein